MSTDTTVMKAKAPAHPAKVSSLDARAASSVAMKNVLSPISETKMREEACHVGSSCEVVKPCEGVIRRANCSWPKWATWEIYRAMMEIGSRHDGNLLGGPVQGLTHQQEGQGARACTNEESAHPTACALAGASSRAPAPKAIGTRAAAGFRARIGFADASAASWRIMGAPHTGRVPQRLPAVT